MTYVARHAAPRRSWSVRLRPVWTVVCDVADALSRIAVVLLYVGAAVTFFGLAAKGFADDGQWAAGVMTVVLGFAAIVYALARWIRSLDREPVAPPPVPVCPRCSTQPHLFTIDAGAQEESNS